MSLTPRHQIAQANREEGGRDRQEETEIEGEPSSLGVSELSMPCIYLANLTSSAHNAVLCFASCYTL